MEDLRAVVIGDIHLDAKSIALHVLNSELDNTFFTHIDEYRPDIVIFNGDTTDHEIRTNSNACTSFLDIVYRVARLKSHRGVPIKVVVSLGTTNHDCNQINIFTFLLKYPEVDIKLVYTTEVIEMLGHKILVIPDEQVSDPDDHFGAFIDVPPDTYSLCTIHGVMDNFGAVIIGDQMDKINKEIHRFLFPYEHMCSIVKYRIYMNHYHTMTDMGKVFVVGCFTRYKHGEEEPKGFMSIRIENDVLTDHFIENINAPMYITKHITDFITQGAQINDVIILVKKFITLNKVKSLRLFIPYELSTDELVASVSDVLVNVGIVFRYEKGNVDRSNDRDADDKNQDRNSLLSVISSCTEIETNIARYNMYYENGEVMSDEILTPPKDTVNRIKQIILSLRK